MYQLPEQCHVDAAVRQHNIAAAVPIEPTGDRFFCHSASLFFRSEKEEEERNSPVSVSFRSDEAVTGDRIFNCDLLCINFNDAGAPASAAACAAAATS